MIKIVLTLLLACAALSASPQARADACSASMTPITFPNVNVITGAAVAISGTLTVTCTFDSLLATGALVCVELPQGPSSTGISPRSMANAASGGRLQYVLSRYAGLTPVWGTATSGEPVNVNVPRPVGTAPTTQTVQINASVLVNQFTVPTANNATTTYMETNSTGTVKSAFYTLFAPTSCTGQVVTTTALPSFTVTAPVTNNCTISTTSNMTFTGAGLLTTAINSTATLGVRCTANDAYRIKLNGGINGTVAQRNMKLTTGTALIPYLLYTDSNRTLLWGDGSSGTSTYTATGTGNIQSVTVYGRVPAQSAPQPGNYEDTVTATIEF